MSESQRKEFTIGQAVRYSFTVEGQGSRGHRHGKGVIRERWGNGWWAVKTPHRLKLIHESELKVSDGHKTRP